MAGDVRLPLGQVLVTACAAKALANAGMSAQRLLERHQAGDWGSVSSQAGVENDRALLIGGEVTSTYTLAPDLDCLIISDGSRRLTCIATSADLPTLVDCQPGDRERVLREQAGAMPLADCRTMPMTADPDATDPPKLGVPAPRSP